jgi:predicted O-methyltransferase YrrM
MLEDAFRYIRQAPRIAQALASDPVETLINLRDNLMERSERRHEPCIYPVCDGWEQRLHDGLGIPWPCPVSAEFDPLWHEVMGALEASTGRIGPASFGCWNDADPELVRAIWCLTRHLRPEIVVETGVARGVTTRFILEALDRNATGYLWSIDRPPPLQKELHGQIAAAIPAGAHPRWRYIRGSSRRRLPALLTQVKVVDLFVHDSRHSEDNVRFELGCTWDALRRGGAMVVDDVDLNWGFRAFTRAAAIADPLVCRARPIRTDATRFEGNGLFGIIRKE